jgi:uncharacterized protein with von Willebrand factor type A (vWA) domain
MGKARVRRTSTTTRELGTRNIKVALRRCAASRAKGAAEELDLDATIAAPAKQGFLDIHMRARTAQCGQAAAVP